MIEEKFLQDEKQTLQADFDKTKKSISDTEATLKQLNGTLNAIYGAIQQNEKMIVKPKEKPSMTKDKENALNIATS